MNPRCITLAWLFGLAAVHGGSTVESRKFADGDEVLLEREVTNHIASRVTFVTMGGDRIPVWNSEDHTKNSDDSPRPVIELMTIESIVKLNGEAAVLLSGFGDGLHVRMWQENGKFRTKATTLDGLFEQFWLDADRPTLAGSKAKFEFTLSDPSTISIAAKDGANVVGRPRNRTVKITRLGGLTVDGLPYGEATGVVTLAPRADGTYAAHDPLGRYGPPGDSVVVPTPPPNLAALEKSGYAKQSASNATPSLIPPKSPIARDQSYDLAKDVSPIPRGSAISVNNIGRFLRFGVASGFAFIAILLFAIWLRRRKGSGDKH